MADMKLNPRDLDHIEIRYLLSQKIDMYILSEIIGD